MFYTTFVGHQGWLFETDEAALLVDPLLTPQFGHNESLGLVYPPRNLDLSSFPPVDAVFLTHEHEDHFNIPSLNSLDRDIPLLLSARSSTAARRMIREMGFELALVGPGDLFRTRDLELRLFTADQRDARLDEWDVLPYLVRDSAGHGSFFTGVDTPPTAETLRWLARHHERPGILCYPNNYLDWSAFDRQSVTPPPHSNLRLSAELLGSMVHLRHQWGIPAALLLCGGGWSFTRDRAWLNEVVFAIDSEAVADVLTAAMPETHCAAPSPGSMVTMKRGAIEKVVASRDFLSTPPRSQWPQRSGRGAPVAPAFEPAVAREFSPEQLPALIDDLREVGRYFYARDAFRWMYSQEKTRISGRKATIALSLLLGPDRVTLEYSPPDCGFVRVEADEPESAYLAGFECWAADLRGLLDGAIQPTAVVFGRSRAWNHAPHLLRFGLTWLWTFLHPLRHTERYLDNYQRLLAREPTDGPRIRFRK